MSENKENEELIRVMRNLCSISQIKRDTTYDKTALKHGGAEARSVLDNQGYRNKAENGYRIRKAQGQKVVLDEYTGEKLALPVYAEKLQLPKANVDHIVPLDKIKNSYKNTAFLKTSDLKKVANRDYNLALTSERLNKSKGGLTNLEYVEKHKDTLDPQTAKRMVDAHKTADKNIKSQVHRAQFNNAKGDFKDAANNNALRNVVPLCWSVISNIVDMANGKKTYKDVLNDIGQSAWFVVKDSVKAGAYQLLVNGSEKIAAASEYMVPTVGLFCIFSDDVLNFINGNIDSETCFNSVVTKAGRVAAQCVAQKAAVKTSEKVISLISKAVAKELSSGGCAVVSGGVGFVIALAVDFTVDCIIDYAEKEIALSETNMNFVLNKYEASVNRCNFILVQMNIVSTTDFMAKFLTAKKCEGDIVHGLESCNAEEFLEGINGINAIYGANTNYSRSDFDKFCGFIRLGVQLENAKF